MQKPSYFFRRIFKSTFVFFFISSVSIVAHTHDYWFAPEQFYVENGLKFRTKMLFGGNLKSEGPKPLGADVTRKLELYTHGKAPVDLLKSTTVTSKDGNVEINVARPGSYWLITERAPTYIELDAKKFEDYLLHENLNHVIKARRKRKENRKIGKESYSRSVKTYISVGNHNDDETWKMRIPQRIEINPKVDPKKIKSGQYVSFNVLFDSKPLVGVSVNAMHLKSNGKTEILTSKTNNDGLVTFKLNDSGNWLIRLTHMRRCTDCQKADWESFWGSLALGVQPTNSSKK